MPIGKFISIEGQDGAGKSTNVEVIKQHLNRTGISFVHTREPGGTEFGESIRTLLLNSGDEQVGDEAELLLMFAARTQHLKEVIRPAIERGDWVLCDRFTDATYAYQGGGRGLPEETIGALENIVQGSLRPDLTLLLDLPVEVGESRAGQRSKPDRFELQKLEFKQRVRDCYLARAKAEPNRIKVIDASLDLADVENATITALDRFIAGCEPTK